MTTLQEAVLSQMPHYKSVVVKGSRFMKMERVVESLRAATQAVQAPKANESEVAHAA